MLEIVETGTNHNCCSSNLFYSFSVKTTCLAYQHSQRKGLDQCSTGILIIAILLHNFYSNGAKTYEELNVYLETARKHPTGRLWVDCFVKPTLLSLMFLRGEPQGNTPILPDQFGEQTYQAREWFWIMKGISTSPEQVAVWVNSFSVCAHLDIAMEYMYNEAGEEQMPHGEVNREEKNKYKEEGEGRRRLDEADRKKIAVELEKYSHPLNDQQPGVYNICNGQMAPDTRNVQNALTIESEQSRQFSASLSSEFHKTIKKKVKAMELLKKAVTVNGKAIHDIETLFSRLLVVGQQRSVDIADVFQFELSPVPPALIDEYGCLRKGDKAVLVKSLSVSVTTPCAPNVLLVDAGQHLYHVVWPVFGTTGDLAASFGTRLAHYPPVSKKIILFDIYDHDAPSAKDHGRTRRGRAKEVV